MSSSQHKFRIGFVTLLALSTAVLLGFASTRQVAANGPVAKLQEVTPVPPRPTAISPFEPTAAPTSVPSTGDSGSSSSSSAVVTSSGSTCEYWSVTIPEGAVPADTTVHCSDFNASLAPLAPNQYTRLNRTISFSIKRDGAWVTTFAKAVTFCYTLQSSDATATKSDASRVQIVQAQYGKTWTFPVKAAGTATKTCASITSMTGNIFEVVVGAASSTYIVKSGDSLTRIARLYNTTADAIRSLNNLKTDVLQIGQALIIQGTFSSTTTTTVTPAASGSSYVVKPGDNLSRIARNLGTTVDALIAKNGLKTTVIQPGQVLIVP